MRQFRNGLFETNSSSVHAICVSKKPLKLEDYPNFVEINRGKFDRYRADFKTMNDRLSYLYEAILASPKKDEYFEKLEEFFSVNGIQWTYPIHRWGTCGWIDHDMDEGLVVFLQSVMDDPDLLGRFLFSKYSMIQTADDGDASEVMREESDGYEVFLKWN